MYLCASTQDVVEKVEVVALQVEGRQKVHPWPSTQEVVVEVEGR